MHEGLLYIKKTFLKLYIKIHYTYLKDRMFLSKEFFRCYGNSVSVIFDCI